MKKITLLLLTTLLAYFTVAQTPLTVREQPGNVKTPGQTIENPNRSIPPGDLVYSQPFVCPPFNGVISSEGIAELADDFIITSSSSVTTVRWWFFMFDDPNTTSWVIRIYDNQSCLPSALLGTWNITPGEVTFEYVCSAFNFPIYDLWANLSPVFIALPNVHYWISISAVGVAPDFWSTYGNPGVFFNCPGVIYSPANGFPVFTDLTSFIGFPTDFSYELYSTGEVPGEVPISNWAIGLGIFLIFAVGVWRFRRML